MAFAEEGWALKKVRNAIHFSENVRNYLQEVFLLGEDTGHKANPGDVATHMKGLRDSSGKKRFQKKEWLTTVQISRYFSRLLTLNKTGRLLRDTVAESSHEDDDDDEDDILTAEATAIRTRQQIWCEWNCSDTELLMNRSFSEIININASIFYLIVDFPVFFLSCFFQFPF